MRIGYARVSTGEQKLSVQIDQLTAAGCEHIYQEKISGASAARPQLQKLLGTLRPGDVVVVCKLDRFARNTQDLLELVGRIGVAGSRFLSLGEPWADTTTPAGELILTVFAGIAQFERGRMLERCNDGRAAAKLKGVKFGRKHVLTNVQQGKVREMLEGGLSATGVAALLNVGASTIYRFKRRACPS